jgi:serine/threonine protein kinase
MSNLYTRKKIENYSYGLNDVIGKGYSSHVYKGRNDESDLSVAVKVIDLKMLKNEINRILLDSEIEVLKELKHLPHILTLHDVFTTKNNTYIITELCDSDLSKVVKKGLPEDEACGYMQQIVQGYYNFAKKSIIHRDLKPANILICNG